VRTTSVGVKVSDTNIGVVLGIVVTKLGVSVGFITSALVGARVGIVVGTGIFVEVGIGVFVAVGTGVDVGAGTGVFVLVGIGVLVAVGTGVSVGVGLGVLVGVGSIVKFVKLSSLRRPALFNALTKKVYTPTPRLVVAFNVAETPLSTVLSNSSTTLQTY
jgi:hypothetical protein